MFRESIALMVVSKTFTDFHFFPALRSYKFSQPVGSPVIKYRKSWEMFSIGSRDAKDCNKVVKSPLKSLLSAVTLVSLALSKKSPISSSTEEASKK